MWKEQQEWKQLSIPYPCYLCKAESVGKERKDDKSQNDEEPDGAKNNEDNSVRMHSGGWEIWAGIRLHHLRGTG